MSRLAASKFRWASSAAGLSPKLMATDCSSSCTACIVEPSALWRRRRSSSVSAICFRETWWKLGSAPATHLYFQSRSTSVERPPNNCLSRSNWLRHHAKATSWTSGCPPEEAALTSSSRHSKAFGRSLRESAMRTASSTRAMRDGPWGSPRDSRSNCSMSSSTVVLMAFS